MTHLYYTSKSTANISPVILLSTRWVKSWKPLLRKTMYRISSDPEKPGTNWQNKTNEKNWFNFSNILHYIKYTRPFKESKALNCTQRTYWFHVFSRLLHYRLTSVCLDAECLKRCWLKVKKTNVPSRFCANTATPFNADPRPDILRGSFCFHYRLSSCQIIKVQYNVLSLI